MALVQAAVNINIEDADREFWVAFATFQASAQQRRLQQLCIIANLEELDSDRNRARCRSRELLLAAAALSSTERSIWAYPREVSWYEARLPHLPDSGFRENFRMNPLYL
ncbi:hypothetical protein HPB49_003970 [Dermacentor silvarum]|uniref:Uncharacterized protein n=1 Tax=Dermacentor silvarum TaxID=543639 RepID=A0ACB8DUA9_DERSI|nr:hypothetical protein HPB49_003970 [Dermacentor silvarum]